MSVYRDKRIDKATGKVITSKVWRMDFEYKGQRVRESTHQTSITRAKEVEAKRQQELREGIGGIRRKSPPKQFSYVATAWLEKKKASLRPRSIIIEQYNLKHLTPYFGKKLVTDIEAADITRYQKKRLAEGASPRTCNIEIGSLRSILIDAGQWEQLKQRTEGKKIPWVAAGEEIGRAITPAEEQALLEACGKSRSRSLLPLFVMGIETGARYNTLRVLQWQNIDFSERSLRFGKDKTKKGSGRVVPLNQRAIATLQFWASSFPERKPTDFVFPSEQYGLCGEAGYLTGENAPYKVEVTKPMGTWKTAWNSARKLAGAILAGDPTDVNAEPLKIRFHDARHTFCTRAINAGVPITKLAELVGWKRSTMVLMAARYAHHGLEDLRGAVETVSRGNIAGFAGTCQDFAGTQATSTVTDDRSGSREPNA